MAREFAGGTDDLNYGAGIPDLTSSWTIAGWFRADTTNGTLGDPLWSRWTDSSTNRQLYLYRRQPDATSPRKFQVDIPFISAVLTGTTSLSDGTLYHVAVTRSGSSWELFLDGTSDGTATDANSQETGGAVELGRSDAQSVSLDGLLAEVGAWDVQLSDEEISALASGFSPKCIRPQSLQFFSGLVRDAIEEINGVNPSITGTSVADHVRVIYPRGRNRLGFPPVAAAGVTVPALDEGMLVGGLQPLAGGLC